ncbi:MAG: 30S ribosomal protein S6 [Gemmataceae bacterium]
MHLAVNVYESMVLFDSGKYHHDADKLVGYVHKVLERHGAEILASRPWDERRLAYPIRRHKKGMYYLLYFRAEGKSLASIRHDFALNESILRTLILRVEPKLVDTMLALARDEHALAIQAAGLADTPEEAPEAAELAGDLP